MKYTAFLIALFLGYPAFAQDREPPSLVVSVVKTGYSGLPAIWHDVNSGLELGKGPEILEKEGLLGVLEKLHCRVRTSSIELTPEEQEQFGVRHRLGLANAHLSRSVASDIRDGAFVIGLQANDPSALGFLAGLQHSGPDWRTIRVGMVWIDGHADFNTPETSLSGMLGGMPVAIAAGDCLTRIRLTSGLDPALPTRYIVLAGVQDIDPLEQERLDRSDIEMISPEDIKTLSENISVQMDRLSRLTDIIYVHVDLVDIVDDKDHPEVEMSFPEGPTSDELARALEIIFRYEKAAALGIASYPAGRDPNGMFRDAAYKIVEGAVRGIHQR